MNCPFCHQELQEHGGAFICKIHGLLIDGGKLYDFRAGKNHDLLVLEADAQIKRDQASPIDCPHCGEAMATVNYVNTGIVIDSCLNCKYRWLDTGELKKIAQHKPTLTPQQLLQIEEIERKSGAKRTISDDKIAHYTLYRTVGPLALGVLSGGRDRSNLSLIAGAGIAGLIRSLLHSWLYRVLILVIIIIFGLLGWYIYAKLT